MKSDILLYDLKEIDRQITRWKGKTLASCLNAVAAVLQKLRRLEESDNYGFVQCVTCGKKGRYNEGFHGGHYISRRHASCKLLSLNIWQQCIRCNAYRDGELGRYRAFLGDRLASKLEARQHLTVNYSRYQLARRIVIYRKRVKHWETYLDKHSQLRPPDSNRQARLNF